MEIVPCGGTEKNAFTLKLAQMFTEWAAPEIEGREKPDEEFSFDGFKIGGFKAKYGDTIRYIRPGDKNKAFQSLI